MAEKFARALYNTPRGDLRLALLDHLLPQMLALEAQPVLDVGGGLGQQAIWYARRGHAVTMSEPSADMRAHAMEALTYLEADVSGVDVVEHSLQTLPKRPGGWPLINCHAVLEWMADPRQGLICLESLLAPTGQLSLMVFNRDALRFSNVIKGNLEKAQADRLEGLGQRKRLTPISPLTHTQLLDWCDALGLEIKAVAGIRVFQDYLREPLTDPDGQARLLALEKRYCRSEPHWRLGRYLLYTLKKRPLTDDPATADISAS